MSFQPFRTKPSGARRAAPSALVALGILGLFATSSVGLAAAAAPAAGEVRYIFLTQGNRAGGGTSRVAADGERIYTYEYNDRGRGPKSEERVRLDERGVPVSIHVTGNDYWKVAIDETFAIKDGKAVWKSDAEAGEKALTAPAFYLTGGGALQEFELLVAATLKAGGTLDLLPAGTAKVRKVKSMPVSVKGKKETVDLVSIEGLGFTPSYFWIDGQGRLFAALQGWSNYVQEGWEPALPELDKVEQGLNTAREAELAKSLIRHPKGGIAIVHARLFDPARRTLVPGTTVLVAGNKITAVGPDGEVKIPAGAETIDAQGKVLLPGMWDMHAHVGDLDGLLNLAAGITTVRDMANDTDKLLAQRKRIDADQAIGTRILMAGFIDGPGPFAGPSKVLVDTEAKALAAVDNYKKLGYVQIKMYSSLDPKLVPPIIKRAHELGMRVSGHIPNGMNVEDAVRAGFDEQQHVNFLFLNFLPKTIDTRTPARFSEVAENAVDIDLKSEKAEAFFRLLKEHDTVSDPTLVAFEDLFGGKKGEMSFTLGPIADRLPAQVQRGLYGGGLNPPDEKLQRYRDSFRQCLAMVKALFDHGIRIVPGTDNMAGFSYQHELELYVQAGIPAPDVLRLATLGAAEVMHRDGDLGSVAVGKLADFSLVDGDPTSNISDIRKVVLTVKDGAVYDPKKLLDALGMKPAK